MELGLCQGPALAEQGVWDALWFNNRRLLEPIRNIPSAEARERYYAMLDDTLKAA